LGALGDLGPAGANRIGHYAQILLLTLRGRSLTWSRPLLMGVVNANPDSFSDPGPRTLETLVARAKRLVDGGATSVGVGPQSPTTTRRAREADEEAARVAPVVAAVAGACPDAFISVAPFNPAVVDAALAAGAHLVNDVSGLRDVEVARLCAAYG